MYLTVFKMLKIFLRVSLNTCNFWNHPNHRIIITNYKNVSLTDNYLIIPITV